MNETEKVTGRTCLSYIDREIGFCDRSRGYAQSIETEPWLYGWGGSGDATIAVSYPVISNTGRIWNHNTSKRKIGLVLDEYDDGGLHIAILGDEEINENNVQFFSTSILISTSGMPYVPTEPLSIVYKADWDNFRKMPTYGFGGGDDSRIIEGYKPLEQQNVPYDDIFSYTPTFLRASELREGAEPYTPTFTRYGSSVMGKVFQLFTDKTTTLHFGRGITLQHPYSYGLLMGNPLYACSGNMYDIITGTWGLIFGIAPAEIYDEMIPSYRYYGDEECQTYSGCCIPFNLLLTRNENEANNYLQNGVLPSDAFLYPMDWDNLPWYSSPDDDGDGDDDNTPDDTSFEGDPNPPVVPTYTPAMLSNYNWYWLQIGQFKNFIDWFWNDVGNITDWSDLFEKISGLYNDLSSAILMCRYYPVDISWIGGSDNAQSIIVGMIEKQENVNTIKQTTAPIIRDIGHIRVPTKYNSFVDLSPYSQLSLYLPFYGFVDLDVNIFTGRELYVKAVYDYLSGTIQYFLYADNKFLINTYLAKMAVDIPLTLQTKNDRDSAIFNNVTNALSGLVGAGVTVASGNPMGLLVGASAMNSGVSSAPMRVCGTVGETGALYSPPKCALIHRRPTISKPSNWARIVGQMCGKDYTLDNLKNKGFTQCYQPRIEFKNTTPMQSEIDDIYDYLEKGVIL